MDLLRATLNLTMSLGTWPLASSEPSPLSSILPSPLYGVFGDDGEYLEYHYTFQPYCYRKKPLGKDNVEEALDLINQYNQASKDDLTRFLVQSLTLYQDGLDSTVDRTKFLALWQVLETLTLNSPDPKIQVEKRVATLLELHGKDDIARALVDVLARIRHDFVHEGVFPPTANNLVAALKFIVDSVIRRLFYLARHISTVPELEAYFKYASVSSGQFESLRREIEEEEARLAVEKTALEKIRGLRDSG
jgi:hypothetical protein